MADNKTISMGHSVLHEKNLNKIAYLIAVMYRDTALKRENGET